MDTAWKVLDQLSGVDNAVNAAYYGVAADYYKVCTASKGVTVVLTCAFVYRQKQSMRLTTETRCCTWLV